MTGAAFSAGMAVVVFAGLAVAGAVGAALVLVGWMRGWRGRLR